MEGRINKDGSLSIKRGNRFVPMVCHFATSFNHEEDGRTGSSCGGCCPLFGEPEPIHGMAIGGPSEEIVGYKLSLCHKTLEFDEFTDER